MGESPWLTLSEASSGARLDLFCFPCLGGCAQDFQAWPSEMPQGVRVHGFQPAGRRERLAEPPESTMTGAVMAAVSSLKPLLSAGRPFALYGHSLGALTALEAARELRRQGLREPRLLVVAGWSAPQVWKLKRPRLRDAADGEFIEGIRPYVPAVPDWAWGNPRMLELLLPVLRADCGILESYSYVEELPLACLLSAFGGERDPLHPKAAIEGWRAQTTGPFEAAILPGGHFFATEAGSPFLGIVAERLRRALSDPGSA